MKRLRERLKDARHFRSEAERELKGPRKQLQQLLHSLKERTSAIVHVALCWGRFWELGEGLSEVDKQQVNQLRGDLGWPQEMVTKDWRHAHPQQVLQAYSTWTRVRIDNHEKCFAVTPVVKIGPTFITVRARPPCLRKAPAAW